MRVLIADAFEQSGRDALDAAADIVSLHVALNARTRGLIDAAFFAASVRARISSTPPAPR